MGLYWGYIGIMAKNIKASVLGLGFDCLSTASPACMNKQKTLGIRV